MAYVPIGGVFLAAISLIIYRTFILRYRLEYFRKKMEGNNGAEILPALKKFTQNNHSNLQAHYCLAQVYMQADLFMNAVKELEHVVRINDKERLLSQPEIALKLAECYEKLEKFKDAQGILLLTLKKYPIEFNLLIRVSDIYMRRGMPKHASDYMDLALKIDTDNPELMIKMAECLERADDLRSALDYLHKAYEKDSHNTKVSFKIARIYYYFTNYSKAEKFYSESSKSPEYRIESLRFKAECLLKQGNKDAAYYIMTQALKACGNDLLASIEILYRLSEYHIQDMDIVGGIEYLERIEVIKPDYKDVEKKLQKFRDFKTNSRLTEYAFSSNGDFLKLASKIIGAMGTVEKKHRIVRKRDFVFHVFAEDDPMKKKIYIYFSRNISPVGEWEIRQLAEEMRVLRISKGIIFSVGGFSPQAREYTKSRLINLMDKQEIAKILQTLKHSSMLKNQSV
ncbi:MAG: restriction endonuclease [Spirochaetes bacterium]|nr:restriction endonuclease [Spirochaetota bacterium]